ncbi:MerR family transcriptional regulator [Actinoplanes sp. NPDC051343]|uniref:MerR family transcriptional regulator n=1 Tax=Actinoplanes sp. NPDC051343 TaxID=3363906 RepID=UPI0037A80AC3
MFTIGDFAGLGRVSVRMLRHYDAIGLIRPAHVDPHSGYRYYTAAQLRVLNRVIALKDLGFTLQQVKSMIEDKIEPSELRGMLRLRRSELATQVEADAARLTQVDARLRLIEIEGHMDTGDVIVKHVPALRVARLSGTAASYEDTASIEENLSPLYPRLLDLMREHGVFIAGAPMAYYEPAPTEPGDETVAVHAAFPIATEVDPYSLGFDVVDLPPLGPAATLLHEGNMMQAMGTVQKLASWIDDNGYRPTEPGFPREIFLECPPYEFDKWITELQIPVTPTEN